MFGVGFTEILMIAFVTFIFVGPKRAVATFHKIGVWLQKARIQWNDIKQKEIPEWDETPFYDVKIELNKSLDDLRSATNPDPKAVNPPSNRHT